VSAAPSRRRHLLAGAAVVFALALGACTGQTDPSDYSDGVRENWMEGCVTPAGEAEGGLSESTCGCIYTHVEENMDFSDFKSANSDRREEPTVLQGPGWDEAFEACGVRVGGGDVSDEDVTPTTVAGDATTTTAG
jgi:hypothetical protein